MRWNFQTMCQGSVRRDGVLLALSIAGADWDWIVAVIETPEPGPNAESLGSHAKVQSILEQHSHQVLESQPSLRAAMDLAERYAKWWKGSRATHFDCPCEEIREEEGTAS
jgi:hypothetical protein